MSSNVRMWCVYRLTEYIISVTLFVNRYGKQLKASCFHFNYFHVVLQCASIFSCDQAALQMIFSVCPSVCLSLLFDYVPIILSSWNFQELLPMTKVRSMQKVWIDIWWWNDAYGLMLFRRGALLFFKVIRQVSRSHGSKNRRIWPRLGVSGL